MEGGIPTRLTLRGGRSFGLTVGAALFAIGAFLWWRGHLRVAGAFGLVGLLLVAAALVMPTRLNAAERAWMAMALAISKVTTPILMGMVYFLVVMPTGLLRCKLGGDPLAHRATGDSYWKPRPPGERRTRSLKRQF